MKNAYIIIVLLSFITVKAQNKFPSTGNVGIGTINPTEKLHLREGNMNIYGLNTSRYIRFTEDKKQGGFINYDGIKNVLNIGVHEANSDDVSDDKNSISIVRKTGDIGIRTTSPIANFHVKGDFYLQGEEAYKDGWRKTNFNWQGHSLIMGSPKGIARHNVIELKPGGTSKAELFSMLEFYQAINENKSEKRIRITSSKSPTYFNAGNVGIGTTKPDAKLAVNGNIHTKEVKVDLNGWADFVFDKNYNLPSLQEVEKHIKEKGHLAEIPSTKEVKQNGIKLGEINKKLLQKIEELTLYTIQQQKEIEKSKKENNDLLSVVKSLTKRIEKIEKAN